MRLAYGINKSREGFSAFAAIQEAAENNHRNDSPTDHRAVKQAAEQTRVQPMTALIGSAVLMPTEAQLSNRTGTRILKAIGITNRARNDYPSQRATITQQRGFRHHIHISSQPDDSSTYLETFQVLVSLLEIRFSPPSLQQQQ